MMKEKGIMHKDVIMLAISTLPADQLLSLPMLQANQVKDTLYAYQLSMILQL
jgi:hypothetical protein